MAVRSQVVVSSEALWLAVGSSALCMSECVSRDTNISPYKAAGSLPGHNPPVLWHTHQTICETAL